MLCTVLWDESTRVCVCVCSAAAAAAHTAAQHMGRFTVCLQVFGVISRVAVEIILHGGNLSETIKSYF